MEVCTGVFAGLLGVCTGVVSGLYECCCMLHVVLLYVACGVVVYCMLCFCCVTLLFHEMQQHAGNEELMELIIKVIMPHILT